ncbi:PAS domain S-box protein [Hymenobacter setariae]|uniref:histidine kinase n=1 Tax=Hymenobacter setariae TaxID=2594794 RepID=A0A558C178_9BACT|nr:PAS domain-containing protein [Hymenobacter setariae]TVT42541.1 PAS domain S-box protein [Hymenobacter setariae]
MLPSDEQSAALLHTLLDVSLTGVILFRPVYDAAGAAIVDLAYEHLNPAAQHMLRLPERPAESFLALYPSAAAQEGVFAFYCDTFLGGHLGRHQFNYQHDGLDGYFLLAAQRQGALLVVSFTDTNDQPRSAVEQALRESQAREQAARHEAERQRQQLYNMFEQAPAMICILDGPAHTFQFVNPPYQALVGTRPLVGQPIAEAMPELAGQPIFGLLDRVYQTGETFYASEMLVQLDHRNEGHADLEQRYYNFIYQARHSLAGEIDGILVFAYEVTSQVQARQQVQDLNEELAAINEELRASNEEYLLANTALTLTQQELQTLNHELEARVQERIRQLAQEREGFFQILTQTTAAVCILRGPEHRFLFYNRAYERLFPGRTLVGRTIAEVFPETIAQGLGESLDGVYATGEPYYGYEVPVWLKRPDGQSQLLYLNFAYSAYREAGEIVGISIFAYDVTEGVVAKQQHEAQQGQLQELFEQAPVAIAIFRGPQYVIEFANPAVCAIWGRTPAQALGTPLFKLLPEAAGQGFEALLDGVMATGEPFVAHELPSYINRQGRRDLVYWNFVYQPLREDSAQITAVTVVATEVTDQVRARRQVQDLNEKLAVINEELTATNVELSKANTRLTHTNADLDTFVYTASHDLKAPITNIESILLALREHLPSAVQQEPLVGQLLHLLGTTVERFRFTIAQLTDLTKLQLVHAGPPEAVPLAALVQEVLLDLHAEAATAQLTVAIDPALVVRFAPKNARSIVYNLLSNAFKYRDPARPSVVQVRAEQAPHAVVLTVQDYGLGLSATQQRRLFGLFQRLHTHVEGTGVGLYLVKRLVENGGGTIAVESQLGEGTTFTVVFPA